MKKKEDALRRRQKRKKKKFKTEPWFLYILRCSDGSFYTGITKDLTKRLKQHNGGKASRYTRTRRPVEMLYRESLTSRTEALIRECAVKALPKIKKVALVAANPFNLKDQQA